MTAKKHSTNPIDLKALVTDDRDLMKSLMKEAKVDPSVKTVFHRV